MCIYILLGTIASAANSLPSRWYDHKQHKCLLLIVDTQNVTTCLKNHYGRIE